MANESQPRPPILKRFANLEFDGVETVRKKPAKAPQTAKAPSRGGLVESTPTVATRTQSTPPQASRPRADRRDESGPPSPLQRPRPVEPSWTPQTGDPELDGLARMSAELNENVRVSRQNATPEARRTQRAAELRSMRPMDPRPTRPLTPEEIRERQAAEVQREVDSIRNGLRSISAEDLDLDPELAGMSSGVVTVEVDLSRRGQRGRQTSQRGGSIDMRFDMRPMPASQAPGAWAAASQAPTVTRSVDTRLPAMNIIEEPPVPTRRAGPAPQRSQVAGNAPIELTPMAARQIQLMAWEAGVPGSPLRILTSPSPGLGHPEVDFAFDESVEPDDLVIDALGVTVVIDPQSLAWVRGRRITWHDVPGSEGFLLR